MVARRIVLAARRLAALARLALRSRVPGWCSAAGQSPSMAARRSPLPRAGRFGRLPRRAAQRLARLLAVFGQLRRRTPATGVDRQRVFAGSGAASPRYRRALPPHRNEVDSNCRLRSLLAILRMIPLPSLFLEQLPERRSERGRRLGDRDARPPHGLDLRFRTALAAGDDRSGVTHAASRRRGSPGDEARHGFLAFAICG